MRPGGRLLHVSGVASRAGMECHSWGAQGRASHQNVSRCEGLGLPSFLLSLFFIIFLLDSGFHCSRPIDEAAQSAKMLWGALYRRGAREAAAVVREPQLNRAYKDRAHLSERQDPNKGRKKRTHAPDECDAMGPISTVLLRSVCSEGEGGPWYTRVDVVERPTKRASHGPSPLGPFRLECLPAPVVGATARVSGRTGGGPVKGVVSLFGIVDLPLEESSPRSTPSRIFGGGSKDSRVLPPTPGHDVIGKIPFTLVALLAAYFPLCTLVDLYHLQRSYKRRGGDEREGLYLVEL